MSVKLTKGGTVNLSEEDSKELTHIVIGLGWDAGQSNGKTFDLDASLFLLNGDGKVRSDEDFIFYNQLVSACGAVEHDGDCKTGEGDGDDETIHIDLAALPDDVEMLTIAATADKSGESGHRFGLVENAFVRVCDDLTGEELARFDLTESASLENGVVFGQIYRDNDGWQFHAVGEAVDGGLEAIAKLFGVNI